VRRVLAGMSAVVRDLPRVESSMQTHHSFALAGIRMTEAATADRKHALPAIYSRISDLSGGRFAFLAAAETR
jgi:hypothetical protein